MGSYGIPPKLVRMVQAMYKGSKCAVIDGGGKTGWFDIKSGVRQGCVMSGFLFLLVIDWVMRKTLRQGNTGTKWRFTEKLEDLGFADDLALLSSTRRQLQLKNEPLSNASKGTGLKINTTKMNVMRFNAASEEKIIVNGEELQDVDSFVYLGAKVCTAGEGDDDITSGLCKARAVFGKLSGVWKSSTLSKSTKIRIFKLTNGKRHSVYY